MKEARLVQLDSLRAFAVFGVILWHFDIWHDLLPLGPLGVILFFVLSGYLITGLLMRARDEAERTGGKASRVARQFYIRRALRIFPAYYFCLALAAALNLQPVRESWPWHASYLSNVYFTLTHQWGGATSHFWSLAVEEQFYLFWPWLILFIPTRFLPRVVVSVAVGGLLLRVTLWSMGVNVFAVNTLVFTNLGSLAGGGALALYELKLWRPSARVLKFLEIGGALGLVAFAFSMAAYLEFSDLHDFVAPFFAIWLVARAARGFRGFTATVLEWPPLIYLGRIRYGIYLYHLFVLILLSGGQLPALSNLWVRLVVGTLISVGVAALSFHFLEDPIRKYSRHFPYVEPTSSAPVEPSVAA